jgi:hypothetical protein
MHATLSQVLAPLDRETVEREREELREQLADCEALLRLIDRHQCHGHGCAKAADPAPAHETPQETAERADQPANGNGHANGHVPPTRKRDAVLAMLRERPGRWDTAQVRAALAEQGIDPQAGTPVKNIMWKLAKDGIAHASGNGVYEFPALNVSVDDDDEQGVLAA